MDPLPALEQAVQAARTPHDRVRALNALGTELARRGQARRALDAARQARELAIATGDRALDAQTRHALARCYFYLSEFVPALGFLLEAAPLYQEVGDLAGAATAYAGVGLCQFRLGAHEDAVASLLRALEMAREQRLQTLEINVHNSLVAALLATEQLDDAEPYLQRGIELAEAATDRNLLTKLLHNGALLARQRGDAHAALGEATAAQAAWAQALAQVTRALALSRELGNRYDEVHSLGESGVVLRRLGRHAEADRALCDTLALAQTVDGLHAQAEAILELGLLRVAEGRDEDARSLLAEAIDRARQMTARPELAKACLAMSELLERTGDASGALAQHKEYHAVGAAELASSRKHAAAAAKLWLDFQDASRRAALYRQRAESLEADHAALSREAEAAVAASQQDPLTGLLNRRGFEGRIAPLLADCRARAQPVTVVVIDIDRFKAINDRFSHAVGDAVLHDVAETIRAHCRQQDLPVRWGGDEFVLLLAGADPDTSRQVVQRLQAALRERPWHRHAAGLQVTLSIGLAAVGEGQAIDAALAAADQALYAAKRGGRDRVVG